jgi:ABC-type transport system involved in multi-copper enzyme maturation permease subunit
MNAAILIATRELRDRGRLFFIAACMAVVPFLAAFAVKENRPLMIATVAAFVAAAYTSALALAMGVTMIGRELTDRRLSFLFTKPVSSVSIWAGKAAAGILTWLGAFAIVVLPTYVFVNRGWNDMWGAGGGAVTAYTLLMSTVLFFGSHAASTMLRSRSALVALDFFLMAVTVIALFAILRPILMGGGHDIVMKMIGTIGIATLVILAVAPVWQVSRGRIDPRGNHAALSTALWSGAAVVVIAASAFAWWVISPSTTSIEDRFAVEQSPTGQWVYVSGQTENRGSYLASFLIDTATGKRERVPISPWGRVHLSADGRYAVWMESDELLPRTGRQRVHMRKLEPGAKQIATPLTMAMPSDAQLSADGSRIAVVRGKQLEVYELASGRLLGAAQGIDGPNVTTLIFAGPDVVRVVEGTKTVLRVRELDLTRRKLTTTLEQPLTRNNAGGVKFSADGSRIFLRHNVTAYDTRTGAALATLPITAEKHLFNTMLRDGSMIVTRDSKLIHFDPSGKLLGEVPIPVKQAGVVGEIGASRVLLALSAADRTQWRMLVIDLATYKVEKTVAGVLGPMPTWFAPVLPHYPDDAEFVAMDSNRQLVRWDARTGAKRAFPSS